MHLRVIYHRADEFTADYDQQFVRGGLLVRVDPLPELELFAEVSLEVVTPVGASRLIPQVIQLMEGVGVAVGFDARAPGILALIEAARGVAVSEGGPAEHSVVGDEAAAPTASDDEAALTASDTRESKGAPARPGRTPVVDVHTRMRTATVHEKMQIALRGNREERGIIIRDPTAKMLHQYVLKNPKLQLDEVAAIAASRSVAPDVLKYIAGRREWAQRPDVAVALVRNPKTPVPLAIRLVAYVSVSELRQLAKGSSIRAPIQKAVRKKVL